MDYCGHSVNMMVSRRYYIHKHLEVCSRNLKKVSEYDQKMQLSHITDERKAPSGNLNLRISFKSPSNMMELNTDNYKLFSSYTFHVLYLPIFSIVFALC